MGTELALSKGGLPIHTMADIQAAGKTLAMSGMFGVSNDVQGAAMVMTCLQEGISFLQFKRTYHMIENTPSMRADAMLAKFVERGGKYKILSRSETEAKAIFEANGNSMEFSYTMEKAIKAGIAIGKDGKVKKNWASFPENMLWARVVSNAVRTLDPGVNAGIYTPEEADDLSEPKAEKVVPTEVADNLLKGNTVTASTAAPVVEAEIVNENQVKKVDEKPHPAFNAGALAKAVNSCPEKSKDPEFTVVDPNVCPFAPKGNHDLLGKPWAQMPSKFLESALAAIEKKLYPELTEHHESAIKAELSKRKAFENA